MVVFLMNNASNSSISNLDKYQKLALRLIEHKPKHLRAKTISTLMNDFRIPSIRLRRDEQLLAFMYSISRKNRAYQQLQATNDFT